MRLNCKVSNLLSAQNEYDNVLEILEENKEELEMLSSSLDEYTAESITKLQEQIDEFMHKHQDMIDDMEEAKTEIMEIENTINEKFQPINEDTITLLNQEEVVDSLKGILSIVEDSLSYENIKPSTDFINWINDKDRELNDGIVEAFFNPVDEARQKKAERIYRYNKDIYEFAYENFVNDVTFHQEIDAIERAVQNIDGFDESMFPIISEGQLYETMFANAIDVSYNTFTETTIASYAIDTNGIMPDSIIGQVFVIGVTVLVAGEAIGVETISVLGASILESEMIFTPGFIMCKYEAKAIYAIGKGTVNYAKTKMYNSSVTLDAYLRSNVLIKLEGKLSEKIENPIDNVRKGWNKIEKTLKAVEYNPNNDEMITEIEASEYLKGLIQMPYGAAQMTIGVKVLSASLEEIAGDITENKGFGEIITDTAINGTDFIYNKLNPITPRNFILGNIEEALDNFHFNKLEELWMEN